MVSLLLINVILKNVQMKLHGEAEYTEGLVKLLHQQI